MTDHPIPLEDELVSVASAALTAAEADAAVPGSGLTFLPEWRPTPRVRRTATQPPGAKGAFSWASVVKQQLSRAGLHYDQPVPAKHTSPSTSASASAPSTAPAASPLTPGSTVPPRSQFQEDAVAELLKRNRDVFDNVINHQFPRALGEGTASLDGFRYYMIQDWHYLRTCTQLKMLAIGTPAYGKEVEDFDVQRKVKQTNKLMETCGTMLGIPKSTMEGTPRSVQVDTSERYYKKVLQNDNAWLGYYIVLLPCVLTYWRIAERLMNDPSTAKNVVYHKAWTEENYDYSSVEKYIKFINENIGAKGGVDDWSWAFRIACQQESEIFNTGLHAPVPFEVVPNGTYLIHTSSAESLVLAVQDVTGLLRPPAGEILGGYLPSDARLSVVGKEKTGGLNERWLISATKTGYTFKNLGTGLYLGMATAPDRGQYRVLQAVSDPYCWWVNPSSKQPDQGPSVYQIHDSVNLRYTLHATVEALNSVTSTDISFTPIIAHDNLEALCQMWSFDDKFEQPERKQPEIHPPDDQGKRTESTDGKQPQATNAGIGGLGAAEMETLMARHSIEMKNMREEMTKAIAAMGAKLDRMMNDAEKRAKEEKEESDRKYQLLLQSMRAQLTITSPMLASQDAADIPDGRYHIKNRINSSQILAPNPGNLYLWVLNTPIGKIFPEEQYIWTVRKVSSGYEIVNKLRNSLYIEQQGIASNPTVSSSKSTVRIVPVPNEDNWYFIVCDTEDPPAVLMNPYSAGQTGGHHKIDISSMNHLDSSQMWHFVPA